MSWNNIHQNVAAQYILSEKISKNREALFHRCGVGIISTIIAVYHAFQFILKFLSQSNIERLIDEHLLNHQPL